MQAVCVKISSVGLTLYADLLCISQCQNLCIRILYDRVSRIFVVGSPVQDLSFGNSAGPLVKRSLRDDTNATLPAFRAMDTHRLHQSHTWKSEIATLPAFRAMDTHDLRRGQHFHFRNRNFTSISRDGYARSPQRVALRNQKSQFYSYFVRWTRTISAEGCTSKSKIASLPAFRAIDTHDLRRGLHFKIQKRNFTYIPRSRHARSPQRIHISKPCF